MRGVWCLALFRGQWKDWHQAFIGSSSINSIPHVKNRRGIWWFKLNLTISNFSYFSCVCVRWLPVEPFADLSVSVACCSLHNRRSPSHEETLGGMSISPPRVCNLVCQCGAIMNMRGGGLSLEGKVYIGRASHVRWPCSLPPHPSQKMIRTFDTYMSTATPIKSVDGICEQPAGNPPFGRAGSVFTREAHLYSCIQCRAHTAALPWIHDGERSIAMWITMIGAQIPCWLPTNISV